MPFTIAQLTDPHLGASWDDDPAGALERAVDAIRALPGEPPAAAILTGDVANTPAVPDYERARAVLDRLGVPVYAIPGNHDDPAELRRTFEVPTGPGASLCYAVELGPVRLIGLDTHLPGSDAGRLDGQQLTWLEDTLGRFPTVPTMVAMHHPPILTGMRAMDAIGLPVQQRAELGAILARHPQVQLVACGHVHRAIVGTLGTAAVLALPSTDMQLALELEAETMRFVPEPPCFALHVLVAGRIVSHIQTVGRR